MIFDGARAQQMVDNYRSKAQKKKMLGRPKSLEPRKIIWPVRLSEREKLIIARKAKQNGKTLGKWIRETLLSA